MTEAPDTVRGATRVRRPGLRWCEPSARRTASRLWPDDTARVSHRSLARPDTRAVPRLGRPRGQAAKSLDLSDRCPTIPYPHGMDLRAAANTERDVPTIQP